MTADEFRCMALGLPEAVEGQHNGHADFRVGGKVFASLGVPDIRYGTVKLDRAEQEIVMEANPGMFSPASGSWGLKGYTRVELAAADAGAGALAGAFGLAWRHLAPKRLL